MLNIPLHAPGAETSRVIHKIINRELIKLWPAATSCVTLDDHDRE
jgi:hypothetical protein